MRKALKNDKSLVVDILTTSFYKNLSLNYIIKQYIPRTERIQKSVFLYRKHTHGLLIFQDARYS
jgi:hypothetical protein